VDRSPAGFRIRWVGLYLSVYLATVGTQYLLAPLNAVGTTIATAPHGWAFLLSGFALLWCSITATRLWLSVGVNIAAVSIIFWMAANYAAIGAFGSAMAHAGNGACLAWEAFSAISPAYRTRANLLGFALTFNVFVVGVHGLFVPAAIPPLIGSGIGGYEIAFLHAVSGGFAAIANLKTDRRLRMYGHSFAGIVLIWYAAARMFFSSADFLIHSPGNILRIVTTATLPFWEGAVANVRLLSLRMRLGAAFGMVTWSASTLLAYFVFLSVGGSRTELEMRDARVVALWMVPMASFAAAALGAVFAGRLTQMLHSLANEAEASRADPFGIDELDAVASVVQESAQMRRLHELAIRLTRLHDLRSLLGEILSAALAAAGAGKGTIELIEKDGVQRIHAQKGFWPDEGDFSGWLTESSAISESNEWIVIEDVERSPVLGTNARRDLLRAGVRAVQYAPLVTRRGSRLGHVAIYGASSRRPPETEQRFLELLTRQAADLIEKVREEEELRVTNQALSRANQDLRHFAFAASHDLQEPLRMITIYTQLLVKECAAHTNQAAIESAHYIVEGTAHMRQLISDLLAFTEIRGDGNTSAETVDLNDVIESVKLNLKSTIDDAQAVIFTEPLPAIRAHAPHFVSLFQNLLSNAIKYRGEAAPQIRVSFMEKGDELQFSVADNGIGIDAEYHQQIFAAFKRLHARTVSGTGLGLAICQRAVERYGGRIWVESDDGKGSTFHFTLPAIAVLSGGAAKMEESIEAK